MYNQAKKPHRRLKSTSPKKSRDRNILYNSKKKENILAIEETKKSNKKFNYINKY